MSDDDKRSVEGQKRSLMLGVVAAIPVALSLWFGIRFGVAPLAGCTDATSRLGVALRCCAVAALLCVVTGVEAIAHERLATPAINPLAGRESRRMKVNQRYLQNTLEQFVVFAAGLLALASYSDDGASMRAVPATTAVWIASRWAFWIGYHRGPQHRAIGLVGMVQSLVVLLYAGARFGHDVAGIAGAVGVVGAFLGIEAYLVLMLRRPSPEA